MRVPSALLFSAICGVTAACGMSDRDYCVKRQLAWERAHPDLSQDPEQRDSFIESCAEVVAQERTTGEHKNRFRCLKQHITGDGDPNAEYLAMTRCEGAVARPVK